MGLTTESKGGHHLLIGQDPASGRPLYYRGERGLVTIAPPGSGKTQCHILPNLLTYPGPAIVLDVTGDLWRKTSGQRSKFGPVYKIDVDHPDQSDHYNPFDYIRKKPFVWRDAQTMGALLYSRQPTADSGNGGFFNLAAPQFLAAMACFIALYEPEYRRNCESLLRYVSGVALKGFLEKAIKSDNVGLQATASLLKAADKDTLGNVQWTAKNCLIPWEEPQTASISRVSDWHPSAIRDHNGTLYICQSLERLITAPGFVRLILGQHLREFMRYEIDREKTPWVQLFVDEAPQLRGMDVLTQAIEAGRNYNVRVWMAMQWKGQIVSAYGKDTAEGMISACGLRAYMNPALDDGMAEDLSKQIGQEGYGTNQKQRPIWTPQLLAGDEFDRDVIAFDHGNFGRMRKRFWFDDPALKRVQGASP